MLLSKIGPPILCVGCKRCLKAPSKPYLFKLNKQQRRLGGLLASTSKQTRLRASSGGLGDDDVDVAVFRFTLGIRGFEDRFIPRVVGLVMGAALALNHLISTPSDAQERTEFIAAAMAVLLFFAPNIEERLVEARPGRGRSALQTVEGSATCLHLDNKLAEETKKELAWASFALLRNTNCCSVLIVRNGKAQLARGAFTPAVAGSSAESSLRSLSQELTSWESLPRDKLNQQLQMYYPDRGNMLSNGFAPCKFVPTGVQSALVQYLPHIGNGADMLLLLSDRPRSFSTRERKWVAAIAAKLSS